MRPINKINKNKKTIDLKNEDNPTIPMIGFYLFLFFAAILLYGWTANFDYNFDDEYITNILSKLSTSPHDVFTVFTYKFGKYDYRPITILSFWVERVVFNKDTAGFSHFINVILFGFLLTKIFSFIIISKFYDDTKKLQLLALLTCLLFLVHPNHVSVVANIKSRDNLLSMIFGILSAIQFLKFIDFKKWWHLVFAVFFMLLGFLSKADCYVFIFVPLLVYFFFRNNNKKKIALYFICTIGVLILASFFKELLFNSVIGENNEIRVVIDNPLFYNENIIDKISLSLITLLYYLKFLIVPTGYYFYFGYNQIPLLPLFHPINFLSFFLYISIAIASIYFYKKNKIYLFSFLFFTLSIAYAANLFVIVSGIVMDRYNFIPSLGFCLAVAAFFTDKNINFKGNNPSKYIFITILLMFSIFTVYRTSAWENKYTLYNRDIKHLENSAHALAIISALYINSALFDNLDKNTAVKNINIAEGYIDKSLAISQKSPVALQSKGICILYKGDNEHALDYFRKTTQIDSNYISGINYMGICFRNMNNYDSAYFYFNQAMQKEDKFGYAADNLILLLYNTNRVIELNLLLDSLINRFPNDKFVNEKYSRYHKNTKLF